MEIRPSHLNEAVTRVRDSSVTEPKPIVITTTGGSLCLYPFRKVKKRKEKKRKESILATLAALPEKIDVFIKIGI